MLWRTNWKRRRRRCLSYRLREIILQLSKNCRRKTKGCLRSLSVRGSLVYGLMGSNDCRTICRRRLRECKKRRGWWITWCEACWLLRRPVNQRLENQRLENQRLENQHPANQHPASQHPANQHPASRRRLRLFKKRRKQRNRLRSSLRVVPQKRVNKCDYFMFVLCYPISIAFSISTTLLTTLYREKDGICFIGDSFVFLRKRICYYLWKLSPFQRK